MEDCVEEQTEINLGGNAAAAAILQLGLKNFNQDNVVNYFAGEIASNHWDGACILEGKQKNHYVAYNGTQYFYIPSGVDQTFQCPLTYTSDFGTPKCKPVIECFADKACRAAYDVAQERVDAQTTRKHACPNWQRTVLISVFVPLVAVLLFLIIVNNWRYL